MIESGIFIQYKKLKSINSILEDLFYIGWNLNDYGEITYLPIGDTLFFWEHLPLSAIKDIETIIETKQSKKELIGIVLVWQDTEVGVSILFDVNTNLITISLLINRKCIANSNDTDFDWYIDKLSPIINNDDVLNYVTETI